MILALWTITMSSILANQTPGQYNFHPFIASKDFSHENARSIFQDAKGYYWIGFDSEGLCKYDGSGFRIFSHQSNNPASISSNFINDIKEDQFGYLWIATNKGLNVFDPLKHVFHKINDHITADAVINAITVEPDGLVWVATEMGLAKFQPSADFNPNDAIIEDGFTAALTDVSVTRVLPLDSNYWIATRQGLYQFDQMAHKINHWVKTDAIHSISDNEVNTLAHFSTDKLILGTDNGINLFHIKEQTFTRLEFPDCGIYNNGKVGIIEIHKDINDVFWIGTTTYGLITGTISIAEQTGTEVEIRIPKKISGISSNYIMDLFEDRNQQIIISTKFGGVFAHDSRQHTFPRFSLSASPWDVGTTSESFVVAVAQDQNHKLWIGTRERGVLKYDLSSGEFVQIPLNKGREEVRRIASMYLDRKKQLWVTHKHGINKVNPETLVSQYFKADKVMVLEEDTNGGFWAGTLKGLYKFDPTTGVFSQHPSRHPFFRKDDYQVFRILAENNRILWIGTNTKGLYRYDIAHDNLYHFQYNKGNKGSISGNTIRCIYRDSKNRLWIGTKSSGLNLLESDSLFRRFSEENGLPSNSVFAIEEDFNHNLWLATNNGISRFDPDKPSFTNFNLRHGLQGNVFERYATTRLDDGRIFMAGNNGFNLFDPSQIDIDHTPPPLVINEIKANAKTVMSDIFRPRDLCLEYNQNTISFEFAALDFRDLSSIQYRYQLTGVDDSWVEAGNKNYVTYSNLDPGGYEFYLQTTNADGIWSGDVLKVQLEISSPPWATWWAKMIYIALILLFLALLYWLATLRANYVHNLEHAELELHRNNELNQLKLRFFTNISHEFRTPLTLIMAPLARLKKMDLQYEVSKKVNLAYRSAQQLLELTDQLMYFRKAEQGNLALAVSHGDVIALIRQLTLAFEELAGSRDIKFEFQSTKQSIDGWFDPDKLSKIINNLIFNAIKYTEKSGLVSVKASLDVISVYDPKDNHNPHQTQRQLHVTVSDSGKGIDAAALEYIFDRFYQASDAEAGTGIGLELVKSLVELHKGKIHVKSEKGVGSQFELVIPIDKQAYNISDFATNGKAVEPQLFNGETVDKTAPVPNHTSPPVSAYKLLIVDDNHELLNFLTETFTEHYTVASADNIQEAMQKVTGFYPDIVLSDVMMKRGSGLELCKKIKENMATSHIPVVLLTAKTLSEHQIEGFEHGADAYITKPFDIDVLKASVSSILKNRSRILSALKNNLSFEPKNFSDNHLDVEFLSRILEIIEKNYTKTDFNVEEFANDLHMSRSQLFRKLKSLSGQTPSEYLYAYRIKQSIDLLQNSDLNIAEIAYKTGFSSPNSFTKTFTKHIGTSPSKFLGSIGSSANA